MIQYLLQALPAAVQTAKSVSDYFKLRKQKADTSSIDRFINNVKSMSANNESYNVAKSNLARQVNTGLRTAQENLSTQQAQSGTEGTPFATRQNIQLQNAGLESLSQGTANLEAQNIERQDIAKQRLQEAQLQKDQMIQAFNQQKQQQKSEALSGILSGAVGTAMNVIQGLQTSQQNKDMLSALSDEYKNRGLSDSDILSITTKYQDNPQLAQKLLESKSIANEIAVKAPAIRQTIDYALSPEQRATLDSVQNNPSLQIQLMQAYSNDPMSYYIGHPRTTYFGSDWCKFTLNYLSWEHSKFIDDYNVLHNRLFNLTSFELGTLSTSTAYWESIVTGKQIGRAHV